MTFQSLPWLTILTVIPTLGALTLWLLPKRSVSQAPRIALGFSLAAVVAVVLAFVGFDTAASGTYQFEETYQWIPQIGASYAVGVDGTAFLLIALSVILVPLVVLAAWREQGVAGKTGGSASEIDVHNPANRLRHYLALVMVLAAFMVLIFAARDVFLFYVVFEAMLIPVYFMIGSFGYGARRRYAAIKFLLFSLVGGLIMLVALVVLYAHSDGGSSAFLTANLTDLNLDPTTEKWIFLGFFTAFAVKAPMFPVHTWLPDATQHAPAGTSVLLVGVLDKIGTFGMLTLCLPLFPNASKWAAPVIIVLAVISIIYGGLLALGQRDLMRLIAYTSVSHFGFIVLGIFAFTQEGIAGASFYMVNHGLSTGLLFFVAGFLFLRSQSGQSQLISEFGGMQRTTPVLAGVFLVAGLSALSMPGLSTFVSEIMVLVSTWGVYKWAAVFAATGVVLAALYVLLTYQKIFTGPPQPALKGATDLSGRERAVAAPLIALMLVLGFVPNLALQFLDEPAAHSVSIVEEGH